MYKILKKLEKAKKKGKKHIRVTVKDVDTDYSLNLYIFLFKRGFYKIKLENTKSTGFFLFPKTTAYYKISTDTMEDRVNRELQDKDVYVQNTKSEIDPIKILNIIKKYLESKGFVHKYSVKKPNWCSDYEITMETRRA